MNLPQWADKADPEKMPILRAQGERAKLEYMAEFPGNSTDLATGIAAFASTGGRVVILGVSDSGET